MIEPLKSWLREFIQGKSSCWCQHPPHPPGHCEALDGGWNPSGYCWCPDRNYPPIRRRYFR